VNKAALAYNGELLVCLPCTASKGWGTEQQTDRDHPGCPNNARVCAPPMALVEVALAEHVAHSHNPDVPMWWDVAPLRGRKSHKEYKKGNRGRPKGSKNK
jgi:hypothetical protein